jgi:hypothetical protein
MERTESTSQPDNLEEVTSLVVSEKYSVWDYIGDGMENYTFAIQEEMQQNMNNIDTWDGSEYKDSGIETRKLFTTAASAVGVDS